MTLAIEIDETQLTYPNKNDCHGLAVLVVAAGDADIEVALGAVVAFAAAGNADQPFVLQSVHSHNVGH